MEDARLLHAGEALFLSEKPSRQSKPKYSLCSFNDISENPSTSFQHVWSDWLAFSWGLGFRVAEGGQPLLCQAFSMTLAPVLHAPAA